ncbi:MAG: hypothetical protein LOD89_07675 [Tissierellales bacterium]
MTINEKFIINLQGKSYVTYEGLLDLAHQKNLKSIVVELIQAPTPENNMTAICRATATTENESFTDIADASPQSINSNIVTHTIRMASTRAKARVLRDLTNVGMTAIEELALDENAIEDKNINVYTEEEPPTKRQIDTIKKLSEELNMPVNYDQLTKKSAGNLISKMINEIKK